MSHYNTYSSQFIAWELPGKVHLEQEHDCLGTLYPSCPVPPWEVSLPNIPSGVESQFQCHLHHIPLPTKHSLKVSSIGSQYKNYPEQEIQNPYHKQIVSPSEGWSTSLTFGVHISHIVNNIRLTQNLTHILRV